MKRTERTIRALVVSRIANIERDLRLECAPFLSPSSSRSSSSSSIDDNSAGFELDLVTYTPPHPEGAAAVDEEEERKLVKLLQESEVVLADPALVAPHLRHFLPSSSSSTSPSALRWVQSTWAGVDSLFRALSHDQPHDDPAHKPASPSFRLTRLGGVFGKPMGEYVFAFVLSRERKLPLLRELQERKEWRGAHDGYDYRPLSSLTLGIMGLGDIGRELARVGKAFDMRVVGLVSCKERYQHMLHVGAVDELFETHSAGNHAKRDIDVFLSRCDYVVNALPSTPQTKGLLGLREFSSCKSGAVFINIGRGDILNEGRHHEEDESAATTAESTAAADGAAGGNHGHHHHHHAKAQEGDVILEAMERGYLAGAVLDVFRSEPLAPPSRLWSANPEVVVTPHVAAISYGRDVARLFKENLLRYVAGRDLLFPVDWHKGY